MTLDILLIIILFLCAMIGGAAFAVVTYAVPAIWRAVKRYGYRLMTWWRERGGTPGFKMKRPAPWPDPPPRECQ